MDNRPIGVFDSGLGGLTVVRQLLEPASGGGYCYTSETPGGCLTAPAQPGDIEKYAAQDCRFLLGLGVKQIIAACGIPSALPRLMCWRLCRFRPAALSKRRPTPPCGLPAAASLASSVPAPPSVPKRFSGGAGGRQAGGCRCLPAAGARWWKTVGSAGTIGRRRALCGAILRPCKKRGLTPSSSAVPISPSSPLSCPTSWGRTLFLSTRERKRRRPAPDPFRRGTRSAKRKNGEPAAIMSATVQRTFPMLRRCSSGGGWKRTSGGWSSRSWTGRQGSRRNRGRKNWTYGFPSSACRRWTARATPSSWTPPESWRRRKRVSACRMRKAR